MADAHPVRAEKLPRLAYHEAGHAVMSCLCGFGFVLGCTIDPHTVWAWVRDDRDLSDDGMHEKYTAQGTTFCGMTNVDDDDRSLDNTPDAVNDAYLRRSKCSIAGLCATELLPHSEGDQDMAADDKQKLQHYVDSRTQYCQSRGLEELLDREPPQAFEERVWREARADIATHGARVERVAHALLAAPTCTLGPDELYGLIGTIGRQDGALRA